MTKLNQIYKCNVCGNIVEVLHEGQGTLVCCNENMELQEEKTIEEGKEKHVPVLEVLPSNVCQGKDGVKIKIGSVPHPMEPDHYIEWIEIKTENKEGKKFLNPSDTPEAEFQLREEPKEIRCYCNVHGLWKK